MTFQKTPNVYSDISTQLAFTIPLGQSVSNFYNLSKILNRGCASPRRIVTFSTFVTNSIFFEVAEDNGNGVPGTFVPYYFSDGVNTLNVSISAPNGAACFGFPAVWLDSVNFLRLATSSPVAADTDILMIVEPIYQGAA